VSLLLSLLLSLVSDRARPLAARPPRSLAYAPRPPVTPPARPLARHAPSLTRRARPPDRRYLEPRPTARYTLLRLHFSPPSGTMSAPNPEPETEPQLPSIYREITPALLAQMQRIALNEAFAPDATLETAYAQVRTLVQTILDSQEAAPAWRIDDLEEQLAAARRAIDRLATLEGPPQARAERVPDPATFDGTRENLEGFVAQLRIKLFSDPTRFPTPALRMGYAFNRLEGKAQAQILPFVQNGAFQLNDSDDIIRILEAAFGDPDPAATARAKLHSLKQGKKEFTTYFAEFQMLVSKLGWDEQAKLDALKEGVSMELRRQLLGRTQGLTFNQFVALCQQLDSEIRALQLHEGRHGASSHQHRGNQSQPRTQASAPAATSQSATAPGPMDLSASRRKLSEQERAARLREGRCLYCGGLGHMAAQCPNKSRNPFRAAAVMVSDSESTTSSGAPSEHHQHSSCCGGVAPPGKA
jgi:hypothetical protein